MANYKRRRPRRVVMCSMCQWERELGNAKAATKKQDQMPKDLRTTSRHKVAPWSV